MDFCLQRQSFQFLIWCVKIDCCLKVFNPMYYRAENVLPPFRLLALSQWAEDNADRFEYAVVTPPLPGFRVAKVLYSPKLPQGIDFILDKHLDLASIALQVCLSGSRECQVTRTPDGGYFRRHTDDCEGLKRGLAYVLYFGQPVKGGELFLDIPENPVTLEPCVNSIVVFPVSIPHEVLPVEAGKSFRDGRFTVNGWASKL